MGLIAPILVGPEARIRAEAKAHDLDLGSTQIVDVAGAEAAADAAVALVREGKAEALMKGSLHTDELMAAVVKRETGLRTRRRISHCFVMQLVEVIRALQTSDATYDAIKALTELIGKTPVEVRNSPGFVANRILLPMLNEAVFCLQERLASAEDIDQVMKLGMAHPIGPLALADLIGLDTCLAILEVLYEGFKDPKYRPCPLWREKVEAGELGRKSGRGFFDYARK